jgi:Family of unknown function (DUF6011)
MSAILAAAKYKWIDHEGATLYEVGILADGTLHNPRGYPDDLVRAAVLGANQHRRERKSKAAKKAAETRHRRQAKKIYGIARRLTLDGEQPIGPRRNCVICGRALDDPPSIARGIGSECGQTVLTAMEGER